METEMEADCDDRTREAGSSARADTVNVNSGPGYQFNQSQFTGQVNFHNGESRNWLHECLQSLAFPEMESRAHDIETAEPGTCEWLHDDETYKTWLSRQKGVLWIKGKPGAGKSTLLHHALHHATESSDGELVLHFFCHGRGSDLQKTPFGLHRSLLHQLLQKAPASGSHIVTKFQDRSETMGEYGEKWQWNSSEVRRDIDSIISRVVETRPIFIFIDALDECGENDGIRIARGLQETVRSLPIESSSFLVCFTCRPYPVLESCCEYEITVEDYNSRDILRYVKRKLPDLCNNVISDCRNDTPDSACLYPSVPELITKKADGVFLWAHLVVEKVLQLQREGTRTDKIRVEVDSITPSLDDLYKDTVQHMGNDSLKLFQWLCCARTPLSIMEWRSCLHVESDRVLERWIDSRDILPFKRYPYRPPEKRKNIPKEVLAELDELKQRVSILSCGLAEVSESDVLQFIHQSVKEYFTREGLSALACQLGSDKNAVGHAHLSLYTVCYRYILHAAAVILSSSSPISRHSWLSSIVSAHPSLMRSLPFLSGRLPSSTSHRDDLTILFNYFVGGDCFLFYAARSVLWHAKRSEDCGVFQPHHLDPLLNDIESFLRVWLNFHGFHDREQVDLVHILSYEDMSTTLERILQKGTKRTPREGQLSWQNVVHRIKHRGVHCRDSRNWTPLFWAIQRDHISSTGVLIQHGANVNVKDWKGTTPLVQAAQLGHESTMRLLIERGARVNQKDNNGRNAFTRYVSGARGPGHLFDQTVGLLLDRGTRFQPTDIGLMSFLKQASLENVERVLDRFHETIYRTPMDRTPLMMASADRPDVVPLIIARGSEVNAKRNDGATALSIAFRHRQIEAARHLIASGADVHYADEGGNCAMRALFFRGFMGDLKTHKDWLEVVELFQFLIRHGVSANPEGSHLLVAACSSRPPKVEVIKLLLSLGININRSDMNGFTPLTAIIWCSKNSGDPYISEGAQADLISNVEFLLNGGSDVNMADSIKRTPLRYAIAGRGLSTANFELAELLLLRGADINMINSEGFTVLGQFCLDCYWPDPEVVRFLLHRGADINTVQGQGRENLDRDFLSGDPYNGGRRRRERRAENRKYPGFYLPLP